MSEAELVRLSRLMVLRRELDNLANNVANVETAGFKAQRVTFTEHLKLLARNPSNPEPQKTFSMVDVRAGAMDLSSGSLDLTGNPLNVAIDGDAYFVVQTSQGERYTRNGSFTIDQSGQLVSATGQPVLGLNGPVTLSNQGRDPTIGADGTIKTNQGVQGRLRLVRFAQPQSLAPEGNNLLRSMQKPIELPADSIKLVTGALERSNVRAVSEMSRLAEITRAYELVSAMMKDKNENELARLADLA